MCFCQSDGLHDSPSDTTNLFAACTNLDSILSATVNRAATYMAFRCSSQRVRTNGRACCQRMSLCCPVPAIQAPLRSSSYETPLASQEGSYRARHDTSQDARDL